LTVEPQEQNSAAQVQAHTPLPWRLAKDGGPSIYATRAHPKAGFDPLLASVEGGPLTNDQQQANADLIVQAVNSHYELLEALEGLLEECVNRTHDLSTEWWDKARAAIAKAKGETL